MNEHGPHSEHLRRLAEEFEAATDRARAEQLAARAVARARATSPSRRRPVVAVLAGVSLLFVSVIGVGALANSAVPGELLYSVDRAFESVGLFTDGAEERLEEAIALADRGDTVRAVEAVNEALDVIKQTTPVSIAIPVYSVPETTTTTAAPEADTTPATAAESSSSAQIQVAEPDPVQVLKLAAEHLLRTVRDPGDEEQLEQAASELAAAAATLDTTTTTTTSTSTTSSSTTTTTEPTTTTTKGDNGKGNDTTTTTTAPDDGSTTTTVPGDGDGDGSTTTTLPPIILPPAP